MLVVYIEKHICINGIRCKIHSKTFAIFGWKQFDPMVCSQTLLPLPDFTQNHQNTQKLLITFMKILIKLVSKIVTFFENYKVFI